MSNFRKSAPIRQASLNSETPRHRKSLKKRLSCDIPDSDEKWFPDLDIHPSNTHELRKPPLVRPAWAENCSHKNPEENNNKVYEEMIVKKCKEIKRPFTSKIVKQHSLPLNNNKTSILLSHQELAERLRRAWKDREKGKLNLNIFLAQNSIDRDEDEFGSDLTDFDSLSEKTKDVLPKRTQLLSINKVNYSNVFQKRIQRTHSSQEYLRNNTLSPRKSLETNSNSVVIAPFVENAALPTTNFGNVGLDDVRPKTTKEKDKSNNENQNHSIVDETKPINVIIRPITAAGRRERFRNRTSSAFNGNSIKENPRPPLVRASSVPLKQTISRPKFDTTKRRVKSAVKPRRSGNKSSYNGEEESENNKTESNKIGRSIAQGAEIITMVSLVSPAESDAEDQLETEKQELKSRASSPVKPISIQKTDKIQQQKNFTLRKTVKSVSFQQSSIHAVRSFSASFPARRSSGIATYMFNNSRSEKNDNFEQRNERKQEMLKNNTNDPKDVKPRLLRTKSAPSERGVEDKEELHTPLTRATTDVTKISDSTPAGAELCNLEESNERRNNENLIETEEHEDNASKNSKQTFNTPKERQCWDTYCKMVEKGVNVSFDTILRGMLTPTEYRIRRNSIATSELHSVSENANS